MMLQTSNFWLLVDGVLLISKSGSDRYPTPRLSGGFPLRRRHQDQVRGPRAGSATEPQSADTGFFPGTLPSDSRNLSLFTLARNHTLRITEPVTDRRGFPVMYALFSLLLEALHSNKGPLVGLIVRERAACDVVGWAVTYSAAMLIAMLKAVWPNHLHFCSCLVNNVHVFTIALIDLIANILVKYKVTHQLQSFLSGCGYRSIYTGTLESPVVLDWSLPVLDWSLEVDTEYPLSESDSDVIAPCLRGMESDGADHRDIDAEDRDACETVGEGDDHTVGAEAGESSEYANTPTKKKRKRTKKSKTKSKAQRTRNPSPAKEETFTDLQRANRAKARDASREEAERRLLLDEGARALIETKRKETGNNTYQINPNLRMPPTRMPNGQRPGPPPQEPGFYGSQTSPLRTSSISRYLSHEYTS